MRSRSWSKSSHLPCSRSAAADRSPPPRSSVRPPASNASRAPLPTHATTAPRPCPSGPPPDTTPTQPHRQPTAQRRHPPRRAHPGPLAPTRQGHDRPPARQRRRRASKPSASSNAASPTSSTERHAPTSPQPSPRPLDRGATETRQAGLISPRSNRASSCVALACPSRLSLPFSSVRRLLQCRRGR
jgi:hypothetical protein